MPMFDIIQPEKSGFLALIAEGEPDFKSTKTQSAGIPKAERGKAMSAAVRVLGEGTRFLNDYGASETTEPANALFWKAVPVSFTITNPKSKGATGIILPRGAWGGWSFAMPVRHQGSNFFIPLLNSATEDPDFEDAFCTIAKGWGGTPPRGVDAIVVATTEHGRHERMAFFAGAQPLIAHHRGNGPPQYSRHVFDIRSDSPDPERHAGLHSIFHVREWVAPCAGATTAGGKEFTIAIVGNASPDGTGLQHVTYGNVDALFSFLASGPLRYATPKHTLSMTNDGPIRSGAIDLNAYFTDGSAGPAKPGSGKTGTKPPKPEPYDAPLHFRKELYPKVMDSVHPYEVKLHYDPDMAHPFRCGPRKGMWRWFVRIPVAETPPCRPTQKDSTAYDVGNDDSGNPRRLFPVDQRVFSTLKSQSPGIYFQPRHGINHGKPETVIYNRAV